MDLKNSVVKKFIEENSKHVNSNSDSNKKFHGIRKQAFALQELTKYLPETSKTTIFRAFFEEHPSNDVGFLSHIEQCSKAVNTMLASHPRQATPLKISAQGFLEENNINLEPQCSGKYESCSKKEVNESDLRAFLKQTDKTDEVEEIIDTPPRKIVRSDSNPMPWGSVNRLPASNPVSPKRQPTEAKFSGFRTAREEFVLQSMKKNVDPNNSTSGHSHASNANTLFNYGAVKKSLGARRNVRSPFVPPVRQEENGSTKCTPPNSNDVPISEPEHERLRNIDPKMVALITNEIMHKFKPIDWNDIAGLEYAKSTIKEAVVWPLLRPDIFTGIRRPPRGILLFGPPGTGKTLIGKCIASQSRSTFFSISASSLTSKWIGDGEKMVRALFAVAAVNQPSVVFIDEIDSLLSQRSENEHESTRRLKTEFLVQLDGATTSDDDRILIVGATNRPQELDEAARRRLVRRLYIPLPELDARVQILSNLLKTVRNSITSDEIIEVGNLTGGYSGADMETLCREASMEPIRSIPSHEIPFFNEANVRPVQLDDFRLALKRVRASVSDKDLKTYSDWNRIYGAGH